MAFHVLAEVRPRRNAAFSAVTNEQVASRYAAVLGDVTWRTRLLTRHLTELDRTRTRLDRLFGKPYIERRRNC